MGEFYAKMPKSRIFGAPFIYQNFGPSSLFQVTHKNPALDCCWACWKVSKMVCHNLIAQKLSKKIGYLEMGFGQTRKWSPHQTICLLTCTNCGNLAKIHTFSQKLFNFAHRETGRYTICIPIGGDYIFFHTEMFTFSIYYINSFSHTLCLWRIKI